MRSFEGINLSQYKAGFNEDIRHFPDKYFLGNLVTLKGSSKQRESGIK